jgi:adenylosuccinate synthase
VVGAQWGDEGKGRFVDFLATGADVVVRYQGGNNAGHTVEIGSEQYKLHLVPSGIFNPHTLSILAHGTVIDPVSLVAEMDELTARGLSMAGLRISLRAQVVLPHHRALDILGEAARGDGDIGTTRRGIGPAYMDKAERSGIRICDLIDDAVFESKLRRVMDEKNRIITRVYGGEPLTVEPILDEYRACAQRIRPYVTDTVWLLHERIEAGDNVLFEGAQGTLLDLDVGTYPYVTSSHPIAGGVCVGAGVGPAAIHRVLGVVKAYTTRVGKGPFVTELLDETGQWIREKGHEYGATTGRPRRCGWLDAVILRFAARVNGLTHLAVSRMDTLGGIDRVKICTGYRRGGVVTDRFPARWEELGQYEPVYEELPGWTDQISDITRYEELPEAARRYIERIEELTGVPVAMIGVGARRDQAVVRCDLYR